MWMVRAGRGGEFLDDFLSENFVSLGWAPNLNAATKNREQVVELLAETYPEYKTKRARMSGGQLYRFASEMDEGDYVLTYDSSRRIYHLGIIESEYHHDGSNLSRPHYRSVKWIKEIDRDSLSVSTRNTLGAISALFQLSPKASDEIIRLINGQPAVETPLDPNDEEEENEDLLLENLQSQSREFVKDKLEKLEWDEMQEMVAALLRAMGYKTKVSPAGADRGKDIIASPDGFGFGSPRIVVEVKHRKDATSSELIRSFLGGRHKDDKGLYVSTGGFTKDARFQAENASIPVALMDLDDLAESLLEHYEQLDSDVRAILPLKRVYWPV